MVDSYGGNLGIAITEKILAGLPEYLSDNGQAILLSRTPVIEGKDLLLQKVKELYGNHGFKITYIEISSVIPHAEYIRFYLDNNISQFKMVVIFLERQRYFSISYRKPFLGSFSYYF